MDKQRFHMPSCNDAQMAAISHEQGPVMCLAGPGSGKTFVLTQHIRYLILEKHIEPYHILVITFSKASAIEMQRRFYELMETEYYPVRFGTFHSVFFHILNQYEHYKVSDILTVSQKKKYLKTILLQMNYQGKLDIESMENILSNISYCKNHNNPTLLNQYGNTIPQFKEIYERYEKLIRREHKLDFDDMMLLCHKLLQNRPEILEEYRKEIKYLLIDEYQDINPVQFELVRKLIQPHENLFVVGDDDQSIYGFRGCEPQIMLDFKNQFPNGRIITFPINYRCSQPIVDVANRVITRNSKRFVKEIRSAKMHEFDNGKCIADEPVGFYAFESKEAEYEYLCSEFKKMNVNTLTESACLVRTNMDASYLADSLLREKIPYQMKEKPYNPYDHFICQDFLHYLRLKEGNMCTEEFVPVMNRPLRYISRDAIDVNNDRNNGLCFEPVYVNFESLKSFYAEKEYMIRNICKLEYDLKRMQSMDVYAAINYVRKAIGYDEFLRKYAPTQNFSTEDYIRTADDIQRRLGKFSSVEQIDNHIEAYCAITSSSNDSANKDGVHIMTYHASKGLEFHSVFLPDCNEGIIPYRKSISPKQIEEERRLFYVAMTRARERLHILYLDGEGGNNHMVSRFVKEAKGDIVKEKQKKTYPNIIR